MQRKDNLEAFTAQPYICGALGPDERFLWPELLAASPTEVTILRNTTKNRFAASRSTGLEYTPSGWCWGRYNSSDAAPQGPTHAAHELGLAGYWTTEDLTEVHVDALGMQNIFARTIGDTTYISNRITPLARLGTENLNINWEGWLTCFYLKMFSGPHTPFLEITRLQPGERLTWTTQGLRARTTLPHWLSSPIESYSWQDLADTLSNAMPRALPNGADLTLSGGLDSRLILASLQSQGSTLPINTWSTHHEDGTDSDVRIAEHIAHSENLPWRVVDYSPADWLTQHKYVTRRLEHMTAYHGWYMPLATAMHHHQSPLIDGLAGDVLLRYHNRLPANEWRLQAATIWDQLSGNKRSKESIFSPAILEHWDRHLFEAWSQSVAPWADHPYGESLARLFSRTRAGIAAAPFRLFGPERHVLTPFIDPEVVRVALATPPLTGREDRDLRPRLIASLYPRLAGIESTSALSSKPRWRERGRSQPTALRYFTAKILEKPAVASLYSEEFYDRIARSAKVNRPDSFALRTGAMMSDWLTVWGDRLNHSDAPVTK